MNSGTASDQSASGSASKRGEQTETIGLFLRHPELNDVLFVSTQQCILIE